MTCTTVDARPSVLNWILRPTDDVLRFTATFLSGGVAENITAWVFTVVITKANGAAVDTLTIGDGITIAGTNEVEVYAPAAQVGTWPLEQDLVYTFTAVTPDPFTYTLLSGRILVTNSAGSHCSTGDSSVTFEINNSLTFEFAQRASNLNPLVSIVPGTTYTIPAGVLFVGIGVEPTGSAGTLSCGFTSGATQVFDTEEIPASESVALLRNAYYSTAKTLHFSGFTGSVRIFTI